jgi:hypothetical protein
MYELGVRLLLELGLKSTRLCVQNINHHILTYIGQYVDKKTPFHTHWYVSLAITTLLLSIAKSSIESHRYHLLMSRT